MVEPVVAPDVDQGLVLIDVVQDHDVDADLVVDYVVTDVVDKADDDDHVTRCVLLLPDAVVELLLLDVSYDDVVDAIVYSSSVDLLVVHLDVVVHHDQLVDDELLMLILDVNLFDVYLLLFLLDAADACSPSMMSSMFFTLNLSCLLIMLMFWMLVASRCLMDSSVLLLFASLMLMLLLCHKLLMLIFRLLWL